MANPAIHDYLGFEIGHGIGLQCGFGKATEVRARLNTMFTLAAMVVILTSLLSASPQGAAGQAASAPPPEPPVSLSRIREALKKPEPRLTSPKVKADFKIEINEEQRFQDLVDLLDFSASPVVPAVLFGGFTGSRTQPLVSFSGNGAIQSLSNSVSKARRERAERLAREEVARALNQFCATHECAAR